MLIASLLLAASVDPVLAHYEKQTEDEAVAEDEAAFENQDQTLTEIPDELVPSIFAPFINDMVVVPPESMVNTWPLVRSEEKTLPA